ncbi:MAG: DUF1080 domain-containing protein [Candidatus Coatesbacteria bacterium]
MNTRVAVAAMSAVLVVAGARAEGPDPFMGEYYGESAQAKVAPEGDGVWRAGIVAGTTRVELRGRAEGGRLALVRPADEGCVIAWEVAGPFRQEGKGGSELLGVSFPPEAAGGVAWRPLPADPARPSVANLGAGVGGEDCVAYLRARITSPVDQEAGLECGATNPMMAWVNGVLVVTDWGMRALDPARNRVKVKLVKGANTLMLKVTQDGYSWTAAAAIRGARGLTGVAGPAEGQPAWQGTLEGTILLVGPSSGAAAPLRLMRIPRKPPTLGLQPPKGAVVLLPVTDDAPSLKAWTNRDWKVLPGGVIEGGGGDTRTKREFGDLRMHLEFMTPYQPGADRDRGNSGVYLQDRYEVQILETFGLDPDPGVCGAIYRVAAPKVEASLPMLAWQALDIDFRAPRLRKDGTVERPAVITVVQNGTPIIDGVSVTHQTGGGPEGAVKEGPIRLQDHGAPVRFRNIWVMPAASPSR